MSGVVVGGGGFDRVFCVRPTRHLFSVIRYGKRGFVERGHVVVHVGVRPRDGVGESSNDDYSI